jgi:hypothetical protein
MECLGEAHKTCSGFSCEGQFNSKTDSATWKGKLVHCRGDFTPVASVPMNTKTRTHFARLAGRSKKGPIGLQDTTDHLEFRSTKIRVLAAKEQK